MHSASCHYHWQYWTWVRRLFNLPRVHGVRKASLDVEISLRIFNAAGVKAKKLLVYQFWVFFTLLYGRESWPTYTRQEKRLDGFHFRCLRCLHHIRRQERVPNTEVLERAGMPSISTLLIQRHLHWLGHVHLMEPDCLPRQFIYGELRLAVRRGGWPLLRFKDVCKRDLRLAEINPNTWEVFVPDQDAWRHGVKEGALKAETKARAWATVKRAARKKRQGSVREATNYICTICSKEYHSRNVLLSHLRACRHWCADHHLSETRMPYTKT